MRRALSLPANRSVRSGDSQPDGGSTMIRQLVFSACLCLVASSAHAQEAAGSPLARQVATLDSTLFAAYNTCRMGDLRARVAARVEVIFDQGRVTTTRDQAVDHARSNICRKVLRELVPGTMQVFPIANYGAIATGEHRFCKLDSGRCDGIANFLIIWRNGPYGWQATRVVSYGQRAVP
jgi:hypothetical protein